MKKKWLAPMSLIALLMVVIKLEKKMTTNRRKKNKTVLTNDIQVLCDVKNGKENKDTISKNGSSKNACLKKTRTGSVGNGEESQREVKEIQIHLQVCGVAIVNVKAS